MSVGRDLELAVVKGDYMWTKAERGENMRWI